MKYLDWQRVQWVIEQSLQEDIGSGDLTTTSVVATDRQATAKIVGKDSGVIAGIAIAEKVFFTHDKRLNIAPYFRDGDTISPGAILMRISGSGKSILEAERTALNLIGRLSGIASKTRKLVEKTEGTRAKILDTRKTAPLLRELDKYAVRVGGAQNHRLGLYDMILIKENHIRYAGGIGNALNQVRQHLKTNRLQNIKIEIEVRDLAELQQVLQHKIDRVMLDNFALEDMRQAVAQAKNRVEIEASGGITLETVRAIAETGVDYISVGGLTHTVRNFDVSLLFCSFFCN
jgi:nicotinate-nucleotide pyrophosphorylase (carboxylating)